MSDVHNQTIKVTYEATQAQKDASKFASDEQKRTRETASVAAKAARDAADAAKKAAKETSDAGKKAAKETSDAGKKAAKETLDLAKKAAADSKKASKDIVDAAKKGDRDRAASNKEVNALLKEHAREETAAVRSGARAQGQAAKDAAKQWKIAFADKHKLIMMQWAEEQAAAKKAAASTMAATSAIHKMVATAVTLSAARQIVTSIGDEFRRSAEYIQEMAKDFIELQKTMQGVAAITGAANSNKFVVDEATAGARANLKPEEWTAFRDAFMAKSSNYVGEKPSARLNTEESNKFQAALAEYAKLHGVGSAEMADFGGGLLAQEKGPTDAKTMLEKAGKVFATLEASSKKVSGLLPGMTRIMAQGFSAAEAAPKLAAMPEIAPEEESTHLLRAINEIREQELKGKGPSVGITKGMTMNEKLEATVTTLRKRVEKKDGTIDDNKLSKLLLEFTKESITQNTLRGLVVKGPEGMEQWKNILKNTPADTVEQDIIKGRETDAGKVMHAEADEALAKVEKGAQYASAEPELKKARAELIRSGKLDEYNMFEKFGRWGASIFTGVDAEHQQINKITLGNVRQRAIAAGIDKEVPELKLASRTGNDAILTQQLEVNKEVVRLLKLIAEKEGKGSAGAPPKALMPGAAPRL